MNGSFVGRLMWGFALIIIGSLFLLNQLDIIEMDLGELISKGWPVFLIYAGCVGLIGRSKTGRRGYSFLWSVIPILLGFYFLGKNFDVIDFSLGDLVQHLIPVALIIIGISIFFMPRKEKIGYHNPYTHPNPLDQDGTLSNTADATHAQPSLDPTSEHTATPLSKTKEDRNYARHKRHEWSSRSWME